MLEVEICQGVNAAEIDRSPIIERRLRNDDAAGKFTQHLQKPCGYAAAGATDNATVVVIRAT